MKRPSYWTVQILPEGSGSSHSYRLRPRAVYLSLGAFFGVIGLASAWFLGFLGQRHAVDELERYRAENRHLIQSLQAMERRSERLGHALDDLSVREQRFRLVAGLPLLDPEMYSVGIGGPGAVDALGEQFYDLAPELARTSDEVNVDLDQLLRRAELLSSSLAEAVDSVEARSEFFRRMPSIFPVVAQNAWISSGFSYNRLHPLLGYRRPHPGIDISANYGSPVVATGGGRVTSAGRESGYGVLVEIDHGDGYRTRYAHLSGVKVRVGQQVERGTVIGEVGRSGLATGPNLHYEVRVDDRAVNPWNYLLDDSFRR